MASNVGISDRDTEVRLPRATAVKNKSAAPKQVRTLNPSIQRDHILVLSCPHLRVDWWLSSA